MPFECKNIIRLGKDYDGGYLVNLNDVQKTKTLISFGIKDDYSFEKDFSKINDCEILCFDREYIIDQNDNFFKNHRKIIRKHVDTLKTETTECFDDIINSKENGIFLKCDIEGAEYELLDTIIRYSKIFSGIVIEFHNTNIYENFNQLSSAHMAKSSS